MPRAPRRLSRPRLVWELGARVKFHYTEPGHAARILSEQLFRVPPEPASQGHGLYVTTVQPGSMPDDNLLDLLFARGRPKMAVEGVVVLRDDAFSWRRYAHRSYVHNASPGEVLDLSLPWSGSVYAARGTGCGPTASIRHLHDLLLISHTKVSLSLWSLPYKARCRWFAPMARATRMPANGSMALRIAPSFRCGCAFD